MKKLFTLIAAALMAVSANAVQLSIGEPTNNAVEYEEDNTTVKATWYDTSTKTITFVSEGSYRPGWWLSTWDNSTSSNVATDYSEYDSFVLELEEAPGFEFQVYVEAESEGSNGSKYVIGTFGANDTKITVPLDEKGKTMITQVFLQIGKDSGNSGKTAKFKSAYFENDATEATSELESGKTHTFTAKNGWADQTAPGINVSAFNALVVEVASSSNSCDLYIQDGTYTTVGTVNIEQSNEAKTYILDISSLDKISQYAFSNYNNDSETTLVITKMYVTTLTADDVATAINTVKAAEAEDGAYYNLSGQRVAKPSKGLYIQNGKKVIVK